MSIQSPNSTIAGFLSSSDIIEGEELENIIHDFIMGMTNIPGKVINPDWQLVPPNQKEANVDWISFGIIEQEDDLPASKTFDPTIGMTIYKNQILMIQLSFYGPNSRTIQSRFRDGVNISQNRDYLTQNSLAFVKLSNLRNMSLKQGERWIRRYDQILYLRRAYSRIIPIEQIISAQVDIQTEDYSEIVIVSQ